jgi:hypothetical protein
MLLYVDFVFDVRMSAKLMGQRLRTACLVGVNVCWRCVAPPRSHPPSASLQTICDKATVSRCRQGWYRQRCCRASASPARPWRCLLRVSGFGTAAYNGIVIYMVVSLLHACVQLVYLDRCTVAVYKLRCKEQQLMAPAWHWQDIVDFVHVVLMFCCHGVYVVRGTHWARLHNGRMVVWMIPGVCSLPAVSRPARAAACAASSFTHKWLGVADMPLGSRYEAPLFQCL